MTAVGFSVEALRGNSRKFHSLSSAFNVGASLVLSTVSVLHALKVVLKTSVVSFRSSKAPYKLALFVGRLTPPSVTVPCTGLALRTVLTENIRGTLEFFPSPSDGVSIVDCHSMRRGGQSSVVKTSRDAFFYGSACFYSNSF